MTELKSFVPSFKAVDDDGSATWVVATLNVKDSDGDVALPGAFGRQTVSIFPTHNMAHVPLGKGTLYEQGDEVVVEAKFNLDIPEAKSWHSAIKFDLDHPPATQQYSYGYELLPGGWKLAAFQGERARFFTPRPDGSAGVKVLEASPVPRGAGINTRTLAAKSGLKFGEHAVSVLADLDVLVDRAAEVVALRAEKGKGISDASADLLERVTTSVKRLEELLAQPATDHSADAAQDWAQALDLLAASASFRGVTTT